MARITKPLNNTEVKQAKPKDKVYAISDGGGLQLRVKPNGSKLWLFDYFRPLYQTQIKSPDQKWSGLFIWVWIVMHYLS